MRENHSGRSIHLWWFFVGLRLQESVDCAISRQRFANEPSPQTAVLGSTVVLPCRIINKVGELQWTRDGFGLGNERELFAFKRYGMIGADEEGDFSLRISPVTLEDDAEFQCQVTGWKDVPGVRSQTAKLTVYVPPKPPEVLQGSTISTTAGAGVQIECVSRGGKPAAEIQWLDGSGRVIKEGVKFHKLLLDDKHRFDSRSTLTFIAGREHHGVVLTCAATNPALNQPLRTQVRLEVTYPPLVRVVLDRETGYKEGETATLLCSATANPNNLSFRWYRGGRVVSEGNQTELKVKDVRRDMALEDMVCEVSNQVGATKKPSRLVVHYGPTFRIDPRDVYAEEGENVSLRCEVDGSPKPKIVWIPQKNSSFVYGTGPELALTARKETVGTYLCLAKVDEFPEISTTVGLFLKGPPIIKAEKLQWGVVGDSTHMECFIHSATPNSVHVTWLQGGRELDTGNGRYKIEKEILGDGVLIRLVIKSAKMEDFDAYNCSVQNAFGSDMAAIVLRRRKVVPTFLLVTGIIGGVVFVLVCALLLVYLSRRKAARQKDAKTKGGELPQKTVVPIQTKKLNQLDHAGPQTDFKPVLTAESQHRMGPSVVVSSAHDPREPHHPHDLDSSWDKTRIVDDIHSDPYLSSNSPYLYSDNYSNTIVKMNGHANSVGCSLNYKDFSEPQMMSPQPLSSLTPPGYTPMGKPFTPMRNLSSTTHSPLYSSYHQIMADSQPPDVVEGLRGLSSTLSNGVSHINNYKNLCSPHQPLSLQLNSNSSPLAGGIIVSQTLSPNSSSLPRLGIPVDPSQYIVPPRTQLLQGALATHV